MWPGRGVALDEAPVEDLVARIGHLEVNSDRRVQICHLLKDRCLKFLDNLENGKEARCERGSNSTLWKPVRMGRISSNAGF